MDGSKKRVVLVHHHIFKNAGTSFNYALRKAFGEGFHEYDLPNSQVVTSEDLAAYIEENPNVKAISGHHICLPTPQGEDYQTISSVIIRHPLARIRSIYEFERKQKAETDGALMAKKLNFRDFVAWRLDNSPHVFCNYQTLYCSRSEHLPTHYTLTLGDLDTAIENIMNCCAVGTVKQYKKFLVMAQFEAHKYFSDIIFYNSHLNVTSGSKSNDRKDPKEILIEEIGEGLTEQIEANNLLDQKLFDIANEQIEKWFSKQSLDKAKYFESAGNLLLEKKDWKNAKSMFQNALLLEESCWFKPYYGLAESLEKLGDIDEAIANYRKSIEIKPDFAWNYYRLSSIFSHQDALDDALSNIERAIELHPYEKSFSLYLALGDILLRKGKLEAAESAYLEAENIYPDSLQSKGRLSCLYAKLNDRERQELYLQQAIDKASDQCQAYILLGDAFWRGGLAEKSIEFYQKGVALDVDNSLNAKKRLEQAKDKSLILV